MKLKIQTLTIGACAGLFLNAHATQMFVPNGTFTTPDGDSWNRNGGEAMVTFPTTGGNTGGYGRIDKTAAGWGVLVAEGGSGPSPALGTVVPGANGISLGELGLEAGKAYTFNLDMKDFGSTAPEAGMKIESWAGDAVIPGADSGDQIFPTTTDWENYSFVYTIDSSATALKFVPLVTKPGVADVGFDNVGYDDTPIEVPPGPLIPNGDFEIPGGASWSFFQVGGPPHSVSYPSTGGNPGGFAQIDASTAGGFAGIESNGAAPLLLSTLGLTPGQTYDFTVDMKIFSGPNIGQFKVEYVPTGSGDRMTAPISPATEWQTYTFPIEIPSGATQIVLVPLWGPESVVGYDNVDIVIPVEEPFTADIKKGTLVGWTPTSMTNSYQPQESENNVDWTNLGPAFIGDSVNMTFEESEAAFYRVVESEPSGSDAIFNGGFEEAEDPENPLDAAGWTPIFIKPNESPFFDQLPTRISTDSFTGDWCMQFKVENEEGVAEAYKAEVQQNILAEGGSITPGSTYEFSFWAKQVTPGGVSYTQKQKLSWLRADGGIVGGYEFQDFPGGNGEWMKVSVSGLVPPADATSALIQIFAETGSVPSADAKGEVLVDDVMLTESGFDPVGNLEANVSEGVGICWPSEVGSTYQVRCSTSLGMFEDFGPLLEGSGEIMTVGDVITPPRKFYQVVETP